MEDETDVGSKEGGDAMPVEVDHVISQKDIEDFWEHVSTEERISDVCMTFKAESKQVTSKLYASTATLPEKFAVANFLLQVGALKFQVQPSPTEPNVYHTVIILQKPEETPQANDDAEVTPGQEKKGDENGDEQCVRDQENPQEESEDDDAPWKKEPASEKQKEDKDAAPPVEQRPKTPERHECSRCLEVLTSLWDLDLHLLDECRRFPKPRGRPRKKPKGNEIEDANQNDPDDISGARADGEEIAVEETEVELDRVVREKGQTHSEGIAAEEPQVMMDQVRQEEGQTHSEETAAEEPQVELEQVIQEKTPTPYVGVSKRKRGRPRKVDTEEKRAEILLDLKVAVAAQKASLAAARNSRRIRRVPLRLQDTVHTLSNPKKKRKGNVPSAWESGSKFKSTASRKEQNGSVASESEFSKKPRKKGECEICAKTFSTGYLEKHMLAVHQQRRDFQCSTCSKKFAFKGLFRNHLLTHRNVATNNMLKCDICGAEFPEKFRLKSHMNVHNKTKGDIKCNYCDKMFTHRSLMLRHCNNIHTRMTTYPCTLCDKVYSVKHRLRDHMVMHSGKKEFKCDVCGMEFFLLSRLNSHKKFVHVEGKPFLCDICGSKFKSKSTLNQHHLTAHTNIKNFPCRQCGKPFSRSSLRNQHERVHSGHNPFPCEHCGKSFRDKYKLQVHVNWHLGVRPYECGICHKTFLVKGNLTKHNRLHTGERPYLCSECGRGCVDSSQLKKHMAQFHNIHIVRQLTKGPERKDGVLPSKRAKSKQSKRALKKAEESNLDAESTESQAYTIATDALIEISQQLVESGPVSVEGQIIISSSADPSSSGPQQGMVEDVTAAVQGASGNENQVFPVVLQVDAQNNQVAVPVTQSIGEFQSLELLSL